MRRYPRPRAPRAAPLAAAVLASLAAWLGAPRPAVAWENRAHRLVVTRAVDTLPYPLRSFFEANRNAVADLCDNPAQWGEETDRKSTRLNSSHIQKSRMPSSA